MINFCSVCFGDPNSPLTKGSNMGIFTLLVFILVILGAFAGLFWNIRNRDRKIHA